MPKLIAEKRSTFNVHQPSCWVVVFTAVTCNPTPKALRLILEQLLTRLCAARRCGEGIAIRSMDSNHCCSGAIRFGAGRQYTASVTRCCVKGNVDMCRRW